MSVLEYYTWLFQVSVSSVIYVYVSPETSTLHIQDIALEEENSCTVGIFQEMDFIKEVLDQLPFWGKLH